MTITPETHCPACSTRLNGFSPIDELPGEPLGGDLTVCIKCKTILVFDSFLRLHAMDIEKIGDKNLKELREMLDEAL